MKKNTNFIYEIKEVLIWPNQKTPEIGTYSDTNTTCNPSIKLIFELELLCILFTTDSSSRHSSNHFFSADIASDKRPSSSNCAFIYHHTTQNRYICAEPNPASDFYWKRIPVSRRNIWMGIFFMRSCYQKTPRPNSDITANLNSSVSARYQGIVTDICIVANRKIASHLNPGS